MGFPWMTEQQRTQRKRDEEFAARAVAEFQKQFRGRIDGINQATDKQIDEAMAEILRRQREVKVLRPAKRRPVDNYGESGD